MASILPSITRSTAKRAVHLRITPRPSNIGESREIMRLVSQFGEVEYFKSLKYDILTAPNTAIVIFREEEAAQHCLRKDPIRFRMGRAPVKQGSTAQEEENRPAAPQASEQQQQHQAQVAHSPSPSRTPPKSSPWGVSAPSGTQTRALSTKSNLPKPTPNPLDLPGFSHRTQDPAPESRIFELRANPARVSFRDQVNTSHFHGHFAYDVQSTAQQDLLKRVPIPGLSDVNWRAEGKLWKNMEKERREHAAFRGSGRRKSLVELYEEGERERGGDGRSQDAIS